MKITVFKNGNFNIKSEEKGEENNLLEDLINSIELDFELAGEEGNAGNYDVYYPLYNHNTGLMYLVYGAELDKYKEGQTIKLIGRELEPYEVTELMAQGIL